MSFRSKFSRYILAATAFGALALTLGLTRLTALADEPKVGVTDMYPTAIGTEWVYKVGPVEVTERVAKHEQINGEWCARIETVFNGEVKSFEHLAVRKDGIYRAAISGITLEPPICVLKLPPRNGEQWSVNSKIVAGGAQVPVTGDFVVTTSQVTVPAGEFKTAAVEGKKFRAGSKEISFTHHFAPKFGKVKQTITTDGEPRNLELKEFHAGRAN